MKYSETAERKKKPFPNCLDKAHNLSNQLNNSTSLLQLALCKLADKTGANNKWYLRETALSKKLRVAEGQQVDNGSCVLLRTGQVLIAGLLRDERPELGKVSVTAREWYGLRLYVAAAAYLVHVDHRVPLVVPEKVESAHTDLTKVTGMVLVKVGSVVVLFKVSI